MKGRGSFSAYYSKAGAQTKSTNETGVIPSVLECQTQTSGWVQNRTMATVLQSTKQLPTPHVFLQLSEGGFHSFL